MVAIAAEGEGDAETFMSGSDDNRNSMSAAVIDATNKNEHFHSTHVMESTTTATELRVSEAFILQTAENE